MSHNAPKLSSDSMLILEQSLLKVPVEAMRKAHRLSSKAIDKDLTSLSTSLKRTRKLVDHDERLRQVEAAIVKMKGAKRKLEDAQSAQKSLVKSSRDRIAHLQQLSALNSFSSRAYSSWAHLRLQRHIVDYLLRSGYAASAEMLSDNEHLGGLCDVELDMFRELRRIETALADGSATLALTWCRDHSATLKKNRTTLEFDLRFQEFIELARQYKRTEAIAYCRKHLVPLAETLSFAASTSKSGATRVRQAMTLLAFGPDTTCPPYKALYDRQRWHSLIATFRKSYMSLLSLPPLPLLNLSLWAGLAALKLPSCISSDAAEHNRDCPTCDQTLLGPLAKAPEVPWGHHDNSIIVCRVTGSVLAGEDTIYALPNGMVYSGEACESLKDEAKRVRCPRTNQVFEWSSLKKVYIT